jgi:hypothetical protein
MPPASTTARWIQVRGSGRVRPHGPSSERRRTQTAYSEQRTILEGRFQQQDVCIFVADYALDCNEDEACSAYSVWTRGVSTLLPETDVVVLADVVPRAKRQGGMVVAWETLLLITRDACLVREPELTPARWRTLMWPNTRMLDALRAAAERL